MVCVQCQQQPIVIPLYVCDVRDPVLLVTRLTEQGFDFRFNGVPPMKHEKGFDVLLIQRNNLYYLPATIVNLTDDMELQFMNADEGIVAMIAPTMMTPRGDEQVLGGRNDFWAYNNQGYLVRSHRTKRKSLFVPKDSNCPVKLEQLENFRRTIIRKTDSQMGQQKTSQKPTKTCLSRYKSVTLMMDNIQSEDNNNERQRKRQNSKQSRSESATATTHATIPTKARKRSSASTS